MVDLLPKGAKLERGLAGGSPERGRSGGVVCAAAPPALLTGSFAVALPREYRAE